MRVPADDPLLRLRAAPRRKVEPKPVPEEVLKEARRRAFTRSKFCREGCTRPRVRMLQVPVLPALEAVPVGIGPEEVDTMTDQQPPVPADNSTLLMRMEQLRQQVADTNVPDEARELLVRHD